MRDQDTVENEEKGTDGVRAVDRALAVLLAFTANDDELWAIEIARRVGLSRPTLYRLLYTLERQGFIVSVGEPQRFARSVPTRAENAGAAIEAANRAITEVLNDIAAWCDSAAGDARPRASVLFRP